MTESQRHAIQRWDRLVQGYRNNHISIGMVEDWFQIVEKVWGTPTCWLVTLEMYDIKEFERIVLS